MTLGDQVKRAVILSAGKGSRLLPLTADRPKCLIDLSGRSLLEWQLDALGEAGISEIFIVTGFRSDLVDSVIEARAALRPALAAIFNPFYHVADNLGSAWMARAVMDRDFLLLNGDTLVSPALVARLISSPAAPISVAVDRKPSYDSDDMKVSLHGERLLRIDKKLEEGRYDAESIGFLRFMGDGCAAFVDAMEQIMRTPEGPSNFYLRVIDRLADTGIVAARSIEGEDWNEVDYPQDLEDARRLTGRWAADEAARERLAAHPSA